MIDFNAYFGQSHASIIGIDKASSVYQTAIYLGEELIGPHQLDTQPVRPPLPTPT